MTVLSNATLPALPAGVGRPGYDRATLVPGIVHVGPGAFHRAHQAAYVDVILRDDPRWAISAMALNSTDVADALRPQDGLYTLALLGEEMRLQVVGSIVELLTRGDGEAFARRLAAPTTRLVTATVTEKGYCLTADGGLDRDNPAIARDLGDPAAATSFVGRLVDGLSRRRREGVGGLTVLSCDNLAGNGRRLARAVGDYAAAIDGDLARWIADEVRFPCSMVDSITPATDDDLRARVAAAGIGDAWPIQRERFTQWVIEDDFAGERPPFDLAGAQFVGDVTGFEEAKLRLLNGAHSSLAYIGLLLGHETVRDAMGDAALARFVEAMMRDDIAPTLGETAGLDTAAYVGAILDRFRNPAIRHLLAQIAWDGSQKLPFRLLATIAEARAAGRPVDRLVVPIAAWIRFLALPRPPAAALVDPAAATLVPLAGDPDALVERSGVFPAALVGDAVFRRALVAAHAGMATPDGVRAAIG
ncbi:mannitol dehydrogenase family protein [Sphingomonas mollis]|uniref:Mannitol dehydrogenase family protein n=1 Tax=Sphingomonas mollis TaxID=2795726 RepID=A0ABS0XSH7_9SPHN|nr:mannitol dehydrogenase family protein [Sphingomonas sp. BT553]MBJ6123014.1 mannitol dehydrogenase family protein [Sphingomonas sp. BT553]